MSLPTSGIRPQVIVDRPAPRPAPVEILEISSGSSSEDDTQDDLPLGKRKLQLPRKGGTKVRVVDKGKGKAVESSSSSRARLSPPPPPGSIDLTASDSDDDEPIPSRTSSPSPSPSLSSTPKADKPSEPLPPPLSHLTCPICLGPPTPIALTKCGHTFCAPCLHSALVAGQLDESANGNGPAATGLLNVTQDPMDGHCPICRVVLKGGWGRDIRGVVLRGETEGVEMKGLRNKQEEEEADGESSD